MQMVGKNQNDTLHLTPCFSASDGVYQLILLWLALIDICMLRLVLPMSNEASYCGQREDKSAATPPSKRVSAECTPKSAQMVSSASFWSAETFQ